MATDKKHIFKGMNILIVVCSMVAFVLFVLFSIIQYFDSSSTFNASIFGTYGDFIGGVLGAVIGLYSIYWLIKTFINQSDVNENVVETNHSIVETNKSVISANIKAEAASERQAYQTELQLFDNKFRSFLDVYYKAIDGYSVEDRQGRAAFEDEVQQFIDSDFENHFELLLSDKTFRPMV